MRFTSGSLEQPGAFTYTEPLSLSPLAPVDPSARHTEESAVRLEPVLAPPTDFPIWTPSSRAAYPGKVVVLVDEFSQSNAEYTTMAFRASPRAVVVGSTTAGADGNVSSIPLPGGLRTMISGIGVFYPDKRPTQRVGIVPDVVVTPTVAGIRAGRDEVLEAALRQILGPDTPPADLTALTRPRENTAPGTTQPN